MNEDIERKKASLRKELLDGVRGLGEKRLELDRALVDRLGALSELADARTILAYAPLPSEPGIDSIVDTWIESNRCVLLPRVGEVPGQMAPVVVEQSLAELEPDDLGIRTPSGPPWEGGAIDLILVPGCGFDRGLHRLGRGGGYYDRFLANRTDAIKVGLCFQCQLVDQLPTAPHDQAVDLIVTETRVIRR